MTESGDRGTERSPEFSLVQATGAHLLGSLLGIYFAIWVLGPRVNPSGGNGVGADGLAAGFLLLFALVQGLIHASVGAFFRHQFLRHSLRQHLGSSLPAGTLSMLTVFGLLHILPRESMQRYSPVLALGSFLLPGVAASLATFWWASRRKPNR
jgi:hypothetical protein